ncbi:addiction module toxin, HicA family [Candidatus Woesearchaeota archaeon]|nr:addiction module toxin, HicA family [Candidatus Woesearchaeota archaeon]
MGSRGLKLPRLTGKQLAKIVLKLGFDHIRTTGSHHIYEHPDGRKIVIPQHAGEILGPGLLNRIVKKELGLSCEEFMKSL